MQSPGARHFYVLGNFAAPLSTWIQAIDELEAGDHAAYLYSQTGWSDGHGPALYLFGGVTGITFQLFKQPGSTDRVLAWGHKLPRAQWEELVGELRREYTRYLQRLNSSG